MPNFRSRELFHTPNTLGTTNGSRGLPPCDPDFGWPLIVLLPLKLVDGATRLTERSVSFQSNRIMPAGLLNAVLASYALAVSPANALPSNPYCLRAELCRTPELAEWTR